MKKDTGTKSSDEIDRGGSIPLRDEYKAPHCKDEVLAEILYRKVLKPTGVPHAPEILKSM